MGQFASSASRRLAGLALVSAVLTACGSWSPQPSSAGVYPSLHKGSLTKGSHSAFIARTLPIHITVPSEEITGGSENIPVQIVVDQIPMGGSTIQVGTNKPNTIASPSGIWPYQHWFAPGSSTTASLTLSTSSVSQSTEAKIYACEAGVDCSNPASWSVVGTVTIVP